MSQTPLFGFSILSLGKVFSGLLTFAYLVRLALMSLGLMSFEAILYLGILPREVFGSLELFSADIIAAGDDAMSKFTVLILSLFMFHFIALMGVTWRSFFKTLDGDSVAMDLFEEVNDAVA